MSHATSVSIIVPTYNERENIEQIVTRLLDVLATSQYDSEILVMDDDSADDTWKFARERFADEERVRVVRRMRDHGLAQAVTEGFRRARYEFCAVIDADLQHPPEKLPDLLGALQNGTDIAIGSRNVDGGGIENWSRFRKVVSSGATMLSKCCIPSARPVSDPMSGFFAVRRSVVQQVSFEPKGYKILLEILAKCDYRSVVEVPYVFTQRERGESKLTASEYQQFLEHVAGLSLLERGFDSDQSPKRLVRALEYMSVGAVGAVINMLLFALVTTGAGMHYLLGGVLAFLVAVNWNFAGNWALTFGRPSGNIPSQWLKFHVVSGAGFIVYSAVLALCIQVGQVPLLLANAVAIMGSFVFNFLGTDEFVFATDDERAAGSAADSSTPQLSNSD